MSHSFVYDVKGNLIKRQDANGQNIQQVYDELDRLIRIAYPDGTHVKYAYDVNGNRTSMTDSTGTTEYKYDELDRLFLLMYPDGNKLGIECDLLSRISLLRYIDGTIVQYAYYNDGRIQTINRDGNVTSFTYDGAGRLESKTFVNGCKTLYDYDPYGRLSQVLHKDSVGGSISQFDYKLDKYGNRTQINKTTPGISETMTTSYDAMDRLTQVNYPDGRVVSYSFDDFNNRTNMTEVDGTTTTVTTYEYDANNRLLLTRINGNIDEEFTYDGNGNMTARKRFGHITYYEWDYENRLTAVVTPSGERVEYSYNGEDNLWQRKMNYLVGTETTNFYTTDSPDMPMILNEVTQETGRVAAHVYAGDTLIESNVREGGDSAYAAYLTGEYNSASITELRDNAGDPMWSLDYPDVYGPANPKLIVGALAIANQFVDGWAESLSLIE